MGLWKGEIKTRLYEFEGKLNVAISAPRVALAPDTTIG